MGTSNIKLTDLEREIIRLVVDGKTPDEIGHDLGLKRHAVYNYLRMRGPVRDALDLFYADVVRDHGREVKDAVPKALAALMRDMQEAETAGDRIRAAKAILDHGRDWMGGGVDAAAPVAGSTAAEVAKLLTQPDPEPEPAPEAAPLGRPGDFSEPISTDSQANGEYSTDHPSSADEMISTPPGSIL